MAWVGRQTQSHQMQPIALSMEEQKNIDTQTFYKILNSSVASVKTKEISPVKMSVAKKNFLEIIKTKREMEDLCKKLEKEDTDLSRDQVDLFTNKMAFIETQMSMFTPDAIANLKKMFMKRKKKRLKQNTKLKQRRDEWKKQVKIKHEKINEILLKMREEVESMKVEESMKRQADVVLREVTRKKTEGRKMMNMIKALTTLREVRCQQELAQGGYCSAQLTATFNSVMERLQTLWEKQMKTYAMEEKALKVMLQESALKEGVPTTKLQTVLHKWEVALFGDNVTDSVEYEMVTCADADLGAFINTRQQWDKYLAPPHAILASTIPVGWVLPPDAPQQDWKQFLKTKKPNF